MKPWRDKCWRQQPTGWCASSTQLLCLQGGDAVLACTQDGQQVVAKGVGNVLGPVGVWALAGHVALNGKRQHGDHGQAAVLDLLDLQLGKHLRVVSQAQGVEGAAGVQRVDAVKYIRVELANARRVALRAGAVAAELLDRAHQADLDNSHGNQWQRVANDAPWHGEVVQGAAVKHGSARLEPRAADNVGAVGLQALRDDDTGRREHGPARVQQLVGAVLLNALLIAAEAERVVAIAAGMGHMQGHQLGQAQAT
eukprot:126195-Chlamydomonas_euryale.AAC.9